MQVPEASLDMLATPLPINHRKNQRTVKGIGFPKDKLQNRGHTGLIIDV